MISTPNGKDKLTCIVMPSVVSYRETGICRVERYLSRNIGKIYHKTKWKKGKEKYHKMNEKWQ